jgi:hypothetical protein
MSFRIVVKRFGIIVGLLTPFAGGARAQSLLAVIPPDARAAVLVNDIHGAYNQYTAAHPGPGADGWTEMFGVDTRAFLKVVSGPLSRAEVIVDEKHYAHVVVAKVADAGAAAAFIQNMNRQLSASATRIKRIDEGGAQGIVAEKRNGDTVRQHVVLTYREHIVLVSSIDLAKRMIRMIAHKPPQCLEAVPTLQAIRDKLTPAPQTEHVRLDWHVNPWAAVKPDKQSARHGLTGIKALGGAVTIDADGSLTAEAVVYAPRPLSGSLRMLDLTPAQSLELPDWVSAEVAEQAVLLHANVPAALEGMGPVFDDLFAEGAEGTYEDVLEDLKDPDGLNVDLRRDLFPLLGPRVVLVHDRAASETDKSSLPALVAFETSQPAKVSRVMDILMEGDRQASRVEMAGAQVWQLASEGDAPDSAATVTRGYAIYANDASLLRRLLTAAAGTALEDQPGFAGAKQAILARRSQNWCAILGRTLSSGEATRGAKWRSPVDAVFVASWSEAFADVDEAPAASWWTFDRLPFLESTGVVLGYVEEDGWLFLSEK